jgi:hypothetical protein
LTVISAVYEVLIRDNDDGRRWPVKRDRNHITDQKVTRRTKKSPRMSDPIRIVPLHLPSELYRPAAGIAAPPAAQLTYRGGPLLSSAKVFTIFWGQAWQTSPNSDLANQINQFFSFVLSSALIDQLAEYSVPGQTIGQGSFIGTVTITQPTLPNPVTDAAIQTTLQQQIKNNSSVPKPDADTVYFIYLPPGIAVVQGGSRSCQAFCGYHDTFGSGIYYAVMPFPNCSGCLGGMTSLDALTSTSSHELCEAITDPVTRPGLGMTTRMARLAISVPGRPRNSGITRCSSNGRTRRRTADEAVKQDPRTRAKALAGNRPCSLAAG